MTPLTLGALAAAMALMALPVVADAPLPVGGAARHPIPASVPAVADAEGRVVEGLEGGPFERGTWPVSPPVVVTEFDDTLPYAAGHRGVDLSAHLGQVVVAAGDGTVTTAGPVAGRPVVVVAHTASLRTTYLPVEPLVDVGDRVLAGEPIGVVVPPAHCGAATCLHWGARSGDRYVDPRSLLPVDSRPIVLLPLEPP